MRGSLCPQRDYLPGETQAFYHVQPWHVRGSLCPQRDCHPGKTQAFLFFCSSLGSAYAKGWAAKKLSCNHRSPLRAKTPPHVPRLGGTKSRPTTTAIRCGQGLPHMFKVGRHKNLGPPFLKGGGSRATLWRVWAEPNLGCVHYFAHTRVGRHKKMSQNLRSPLRAETPPHVPR